MTKSFLFRQPYIRSKKYKYRRTFKLPDGQVVKVGRERFMAPEILMNPMSGGIEADGCG